MAAHKPNANEQQQSTSHKVLIPALPALSHSSWFGQMAASTRIFESSTAVTAKYQHIAPSQTFHVQLFST